LLPEPRLGLKHSQNSRNNITKYYTRIQRKCLQNIYKTTNKLKRDPYLGDLSYDTVGREMSQNTGISEVLTEPKSLSGK
jgi:hypothetical protein